MDVDQAEGVVNRVATDRPATTCRRLLVVVLVLQIALLAYSATLHSYTIDESAHLAAGVAIWKYHTFGFYRVNPPLVKLTATIPVYFSNPVMNLKNYTPIHGARPEWTVGTDFLEANQQKCFKYLTVARWFCIPFCLLGTLMCFKWATELYTPWAGLIAASLWALNPTVLGHGQLITADVSSGSLGLLSVYVYWRWLAASSYRNTFIAGGCLGLALMTKFTWILFFGLFPLIWIVLKILPNHGFTQTNSNWKSQSIQLVLILCLACLVVNSMYLFTGSFRKLGSYGFVSHSLGGEPVSGKPVSVPRYRFRGTSCENLPVPFPEDFILGIDQQRLDLETPHPVFVAGTMRARGTWWYYLYALFVKEPVSNILLFFMACVAFVTVGKKSNRNSELVLLAPAVVVLLATSLQSNMTNHPRYLIAMYPFVFIWISGLSDKYSAFGSGVLRQISHSLVCISLVVGLYSFPNGLSFFNSLAGGPGNGHNHLLDSSIDWGQDSLKVKKWIESHPELEGIQVIPTKTSVPSHIVGVAGIDHPGEPLLPGWYAVSVNKVYGTERIVQLESLKPYATIGNTHFVFKVPGSEEDHD